MSAHAHAHGHGHAHGARERGAPLVTALVLTAAIAVLELAGGIVAHSLALQSDAAHVFMDAIALGIAVFAAAQVRRPPSARRSFGYARVEILAALANGGLLFAIVVLIAVAAVRRLGSAELPEGGLMLGVALVGAAVNVALGLALARFASRDLNVKAAFFHVASDALGAVAVALAGALVLAFRQPWIDSAASLAVAAIIGVGVARIVRESADVLLESAPEHAAIPDVRTSLRAIEGVVDVHDLHVWTIGSGRYALSAHVLLADARISEASAILDRIDAKARDAFGIGHVTIQFECESCEADDRIVCTQARRADGS